MKRFNDFYEAFNFLKEHKMCKCNPYSEYDNKISEFECNYFDRCLDVEVVKVNPETNILETDWKKVHLNTKTQIWLEFGEAYLDVDEDTNVQFIHDYNLDCSADTFEEAIIELANLVDKYYNDDGTEKEI